MGAGSWGGGWWVEWAEGGKRRERERGGGGGEEEGGWRENVAGEGAVWVDERGLGHG